jgi:hypothetical protein
MRRIALSSAKYPITRYSPRMAIHAPPLPTDAVWLNVERALEPGELRGRILLVDFWTYA